MAAPTYDLGDAPVLTIRCYDIDGTLADPTGLTVVVRPAGSSASTYTYGSSSELTKDSTGIYKLAHPVITLPVRHNVKADATGANAAAEQSYFLVRASNVA